jgi:hypothetical protein
MPVIAKLLLVDDLIDLRIEIEQLEEVDDDVGTGTLRGIEHEVPPGG